MTGNLEVVTTRHNAAIDPVLSAWGWEIPVYLFLGGLVAGLLILGAGYELLHPDRPRSRALRAMPFAALGLLSLGMLALFLDLAHKLHVYRFYLAFRWTSPMSWGSWILLLVYPVAFLHGVGSLTAGQRETLLARRALAPLLRPLLRWADRARRAVLKTSVVAGLGLGLYTGLLLGTLAARPQWNTAVLGPLFLASGLSTGAAFLLLFRLDEREHDFVVRWDVGAILVELLLLGAMLLGFAAGDRSAQHALYHLMGGPWTSAFWSLVVFAGLLVPLAMELIGRRRRLPLAALAPALILAGGFALRWVLLVAGQASSFREFP
ncbi:MAG: polysulfide reductase NrfD [Deltaproteobacteria bacterium]|nr:polysulfide reductase NrfD [Deltaproteobacteria bacterium]